MCLRRVFSFDSLFLVEWNYLQMFVVFCLAWLDAIFWCRFVIGSFTKKRVDGVVHRLEAQELCWDRCKYGQIWHDLTVFIKNFGQQKPIDKVEFFLRSDISTNYSWRKTKVNSRIISIRTAVTTWHVVMPLLKVVKLPLKLPLLGSMLLRPQETSCEFFDDSGRY